MMLSRIMEVIGAKNTKLSLFIFMSPGKLPNQVSLFPRKNKITPTTTTMIPIIIKYLPS